MNCVVRTVLCACIATSTVLAQAPTPAAAPGQYAQNPYGDKPRETKTRTDAAIDWVIYAYPAAIFANLGDDFVVQTETDRNTAGATYSLPSFLAGAAVEFQRVTVDAGLGAGFMLSSELRSLMLQANVAAVWTLTRSLAVGPHLSLLYFPSPKWGGEGDVELSGAAGSMLGLQFYMGDKITYVLSLDLLNVKFDAEPELGTVVEDDFDLSALGLQFGVRGQF